MNNDNKNEEKQKKLFKGKFDKKIKIKGPDWFHDTSGEELEIIEIKEEKEQ